jgi:hypothetical protein
LEDFFEPSLDVHKKEAAEPSKLPLGLKHRVKVLLKANPTYKSVTGSTRDHFKFDLFTDEELGITPELFERNLQDTVSPNLLLSKYFSD